MTPERLAFLRELGIRLAPELARLYVINCPEDLPAPDGVKAYVSVDGDAALKSHLKSINQWVGPGSVVCFVDQQMSEVEESLIFVHELAHVLTLAKPVDVAVTESAVMAATIRYENWARDPEPANSDLPAWFPDHGRDHVRVCLHLWWRLTWTANVVLPLSGLCAGMRYELSEPYSYWRGLGNEPLLMRNKPFSEILQTSPPRLFAEFWQADMRAWNKAEAVANLEAVA